MKLAIAVLGLGLVSAQAHAETWYYSWHGLTECYSTDSPKAVMQAKYGPKAVVSPYLTVDLVVNPDNSKKFWNVDYQDRVNGKVRYISDMHPFFVSYDQCVNHHADWD